MKSFFPACMAILVAGIANAQEAGDISAAVGISSLGANLEAAYQIDPTYRVRGAFIGGIDVSYEESDADGEFEGNFQLGGLALLGDFYPLQSGWRISGGLFFSNSELSATGTTDVDGVDIDAETTAEFSSAIAPMVTTGYDLRFGDGWSFNSEIGLIFTGGIDLAVTADDPTLQSEIDDDADVQDAIDDAADISLYPYIGFGLSYTF